MSATSFDDLPPETIIEILLRLPVKDLVRSTSVNKTWELYLWNPYVKRHRVLVSSCYKKHLDNLETTCALGMGFDKLMNDYKIVRIIYVEDDQGELLGDVAPKVEIFSLTENVWRKIKNPGVPRLDIEDGVFVDGCYYWLERNYAIVDDTSTCHGHKLRIMSFDFHSELFGEFNLPDDLSQILARNPINKLMRFEDSLALCVLDEPLNKGDSGLPYCIWLMRQENGVVPGLCDLDMYLKSVGIL
nr:PREDICTED: putative F-box protein At5g15670 [Daucus carota subsp. sativus]